ncbi:MAG: pyridoxamine 5'-phosphate oxidase family protein [Thermoleophilia bacterium]|nr:pyridoxamine 5'-phosphate oxidase family protein [Thermoleophilia bacterium]
MDARGEAWGLVRELLDSQRFAVLSTLSETGPYSSLIAFWASDHLSQVVFATMRASRKFSLLAAHPQVALLFDDRSNRDSDVSEATAVTAIGIAAELADEGSRAAAWTALAARHPGLTTFLADPGCAFVRVDVDVFYVVTRLQNVLELRTRGSSH